MQVTISGAVLRSYVQDAKGETPASVSLTVADRDVPGGEFRLKLLGKLEKPLLPGDLVSITATVKSGIYTDDKGKQHPFNTAQLGQYTVKLGK